MIQIQQNKIRKKAPINKYLDALRGSRGGRGREAIVGVEPEEEEDRESKETDRHGEEQADEPVPLPEGKIGMGIPSRFSHHDPGGPNRARQR